MNNAPMSDVLRGVNTSDCASGEMRTWALQDLCDDFADLAKLTADRMAVLRGLRDELSRPGCSVPPWVWKEVSAGIRWLVKQYSVTAAELAEFARCSEGVLSRGLLADLTAARRYVAEVLRTRQPLTAALLVAADWHSPSVAHSVHSTAGRYDGRVIAHHDDYKRDRHPDEAAWERRWVDEMVDNPHGHQLRALMTASGMAAFTTVLNHVAEQVGSRPVLMGAATYHECRELLHGSTLGDQIVAIPEGDFEAWRSAIVQAPGAVFFDSLCNAAGLPVADVESLIGLLHQRGERIFLVVDNTARSVTLQPWARLTVPTRLRLIVFESLTKYAQLGLDCTAGGLIVTDVDDADRLDALRELLGTNITDVSVHQLPRPDRSLLERRLRRMGRNAQVVADTLNDRMVHGGFPVALSYPGLPEHPNFASLSDSQFRGGYVSIEPLAADIGAAMFPRLIKSILYIAAERDVPICEGTSFGFDTTRVYLIAATSRYGSPFLRIAAGTEHRAGIADVASVLCDALETIA